MPVVPLEVVAHHEHNRVSDSFFEDSDGSSVPKAAPKLSRTPAKCDRTKSVLTGQHTEEVLNQFGFTEVEIKKYMATGVVEQLPNQAKL